MHEVHQVQRIVVETQKLAQERGAKSVQAVTILVGELLGFDEGSIRLYWEQMTPDTVLAGAKLTLISSPAQLRCPKCGEVFQKRKSDLECPQCKCLGSLLPSGKEFSIQDIVFGK